jgi:hypothetical protein
MLSDRAMERLVRGWQEDEAALDPLGGPTEVGMRLALPLIGGRFEVLGHLAAGGMGVVYRARDVETGRDVAIKVPNLANASIDRRFELEVDALAAVVAPSVVGFVARGSAAEPFLAMELVQGEPLARRLVQGGPLAPEVALAVARRIAGALAIVHGEGWVHRDVKPGNIAVTDDGEVRLVDFGLARQVEGPGAGTRTGDLVGTLSYLAPEQLGGERVVDARTDVFALGCLLFECLTGFHAFKRLTSELVAGMWAPDRHPELDPEGMGIAGPTAAVVSRLAAVDPGLRPVDGLAALELLLSLDPAAARVLEAAADRAPSVRATTLAALKRPVAIVGAAGAGKTPVALAAVTLLTEVLAPCRAIAVRANPRAARVPGQHALVLERQVREAGYLNAARILAGHAAHLDTSLDPRLVVLVGDAQYCDDLSLARVLALAESGLARVVMTLRAGAAAPPRVHVVALSGEPRSAPLEGVSPFERWVLRAGAMFGTVFDADGAASLVGGPEAARVGPALDGLVARGVLRRAGRGRVAFVRGSAWQSALSTSSPGDVRLGVRLAEQYEHNHRATEPEVVWLRSTSAVCLGPSSAASP